MAEETKINEENVRLVHDGEILYNGVNIMIEKLVSIESELIKINKKFKSKTNMDVNNITDIDED